MHIGAIVRNMGGQSTPAVMGACARAAEEAGLESVWVVDHIAIAPDDAEGSNGRYVDPLISLAWLAGATRAPFVSGSASSSCRTGRCSRSRSSSRASRSCRASGSSSAPASAGWTRSSAPSGSNAVTAAASADATLAFLRECFEHDEVTANGQPFLFRPRPARPPIYVGGRPPHALARAAAYGDGWMPMGMTPEKLPSARAEYAEHCEAAGKAVGEIVVVGELPLDDAGAAAAALHGFNEGAAARFILSGRYADADDFRRRLDAFAGAVDAAGL